MNFLNEDRDIKCWIYENQGKCRYGEKCQWLHLNRETNRYLATAYIDYSLNSNNNNNKTKNDCNVYKNKKRLSAAEQKRLITKEPKIYAQDRFKANTVESTVRLVVSSKKYIIKNITQKRKKIKQNNTNLKQIQINDNKIEFMSCWCDINIGLNKYYKYNNKELNNKFLEYIFKMEYNKCLITYIIGNDMNDINNWRW
eukprot:510106_1